MTTNTAPAMSISALFSKEELKSLTATSSLHALRVVAVNYGIVAAAFALPILWRNPLAWAIAAILLAGRAQAFGILTHETAHLTFFPSRKINEWAGVWLFGAMVNLPYHSYRKGHLEHHRTAGTLRDPDLAFVEGYPASRASLARKLLRDVSGVNGVKNILYQIKGFEWRANRPFLLTHSLIFAALWALGEPAVYACWWLGQLFVFPLVVRLRVMNEHGGVADHESSDSRLHTGTVLSGPLTRLIVTPNNVNFHVEHHMAAAVPCYRLPRMHAMLRERGYFKDANCVAPSLWAVVQRCTAGPGKAAAPRGEGRAHGGIFDNMR